MKIIRIELGPFNVNCYILMDDENKEAIVIDPAIGSLEIQRLLKNFKVRYILNTHGHFDHIGGNSFMKQGTSADIVIHKDDAPLLIDSHLNLSEFFMESVYSSDADIIIGDEGFEFTFAGHKFITLHLPGHSNGSVGYYCASKKAIFSGDVIFAQSVGRTDLPGGDFEVLKASIDKLMQLPDDTHVYPGHEDEFMLGDFKKSFKTILEKII